MDDLRKHQRIPTHLTCNLLCGDEAVRVPATVVDVSFGGMGAIVPVELPAGAAVKLLQSDFPFASTSTATAQCRIISVQPAKGRFTGFRIGLAFDAGDGEFVQKLLQWLQMQSFVQRKSMERSACGAARPRWG
jgi:hypothetical protein